MTVGFFSLGANNGCGNLDITVKVYSGNLLIATLDNPDCLAVTTATLQPGRYYFSVETTGNQNTGRYGQLGSYIVIVN